MMKLNKRKLVKIKQWSYRQSALLLSVLIFWQVAYPTQVLALTGGPSQPEVQSFEPIGTSDMVDVFSGDFNYNIPLLEVEGYPINIAYHAGINMDQEASWVGLGWNINPGVINRNMRGIPDDFAGEEVTKKFNMKANKTWGVAANLRTELFGSDKFGFGMGGSYGFNFNNYTGPSVIQSFNINLSAGLGGGGRLNGGLGLNSSSDDGLTVQPSLGFSQKIENGMRAETNLGVSVGTAINSRGGLKQLTINASAAVNMCGSDKKVAPDGTTTEVKNDSKSTVASYGAGATFDVGLPTYTPKVDMPMKNFSMSGSFTLGGELWGVHGKIGLSGFYSAQELAKNTISNPAYGYLYAEQGQFKDDALMDFNREKDGTFTENTPALPLTNLTFDTYGVSGQGVGGSYRPFRGDIGCIFDASSYTTNDNDALTAELGFGGYVHSGTNVTVIDVFSQSGKWKSDNEALNALVYTSKGTGNDFENVYFKEANEKTVDSDPSFYQAAGSDKAVRFEVDLGKFDHKIKKGFVDQNGNSLSYSSAIKRKKRDKKTQNISFLKYSDYNLFAVDNSYNSLFSGSAKPQHMAEITNLGADGKRYVYGLPAYNTLQREITFSVGSANLTGHTNDGALTDAATKGLVRITSADNSLFNTRGLDNYYSCTEMPPYAHSYLLTSVLSPDYIDSDSIRGPSDKDFGNYTKFRYQKVAGFKWRTPYEDAMGTYTEGLKSDFTDDKANILYGTKDLYYLDSIITKNYFAVFHKSDRDDGLGTTGEMGGTNLSQRVKKLDSISLYAKRDLSAPVKRVHFEYTYDLCDNIGNSATGAGKLTLKKLYFTYRNSNKASLSPYEFDYHEGNSVENPHYNVKGYDRWGNYKPNTAATTGVSPLYGDAASFISTATLSPSDYPYVDQDRALADVYAAAWSLKEIHLPSGGIIKVTYESDDYAHVQNKKAAQMFKIINYVSDTSIAITTSLNVNQSNTEVNFSAPSGFFIFKASPGIPKVEDYAESLRHVYFRFLQNIRQKTGEPPNLEYVSGYGEFQSLGFIKRGGLYYGCLKLSDVNLKDDNTGSTVNPVVKAGVNFGRLHLPKVVWDATNGSFNGTLSGSIVSAMINANFIKNIRDAVTGPAQSLFQYYNVARSFVGAKSWIRLNNPNGHKLGGGLRVKKIEMIDNWQAMVGSSANGEDASYGQEYSYDLPDGRSSGVATYEPQLGGDENIFKQPVFVNAKRLLVPDDQSYVEEPFGESFFPSPSVGYGYVTVKNISRVNVSRHATGKTVHEFYTAKDFPTITDRTEVTARRGKDGPGSLRSLLKINVRDYFAATQGFVIELNDMHGKAKSQAVYQEGQLTPITSIEYKYKCQPWQNGSFKLTNSCQTVDKSGNVSTNNIGMFFDMVGDLRESRTETNSKTVELNLDVIPLYGVPAPIPGIWPGYAKDKNRFRSATLTKVIQRFGILEETISKDLGSVVASKNLAYDAETGDILLTQTTTNYNDKIYSFKYPAWWYYDLMGPAYTNLGYEQSGVTIGAGGFAVLSTAHMFKPGDIVAFYHSNGSIIKTWVSDVIGNSVSFIKSNGSTPTAGTYRIKILSSGRKNNLTTEMATITTLTDPLLSLTSNAYENVLQAGAVEFSNQRQTHCNCPAGSGANPYLNGKKGVWYLSKTYTHLTTRNQSNTNGNTNIRKDGIFESYTPFYKLMSGGTWQPDGSNWTYVNEVNEFNVSGNEVQNVDALNRYSSASFGYNQKMALSVAANSRYKDQGFDGFEDYRFNPCADDHFKVTATDTTRAEAHTGRYSMLVAAGSPVSYTRQLVFCPPPAPPCNIVLSPVYTAGIYKYVVTPANAFGAYNFSYQVLSGASNSPQCIISGGAFEVTASGPYRIAITVQDTKGCKASITLDAL